MEQPTKQATIARLKPWCSLSVFSDAGEVPGLRDRLLQRGDEGHEEAGLRHPALRRPQPHRARERRHGQHDNFGSLARLTPRDSEKRTEPGGSQGKWCMCSCSPRVWFCSLFFLGGLGREGWWGVGGIVCQSELGGSST